MLASLTTVNSSLMTAIYRRKPQCAPVVEKGVPPAMANTDPYELLGVAGGASQNDIQKAYRRLAKELHPDLNPGDKEAQRKFQDVSAAYDNGTLVLNVVNRHRDQAIEAEFTAEDKQFSGVIDVAEVNGPDIKSENNFDSTTVATARKSATAGGRKLMYRFPPHSYTMLKKKLV